MILRGPTDGLIVERERGEVEWVCGGRSRLPNRKPGPSQNLEQDVIALPLRKGRDKNCQKRGPNLQR